MDSRLQGLLGSRYKAVRGSSGVDIPVTIADGKVVFGYLVYTISQGEEEVLPTRSSR